MKNILKTILKTMIVAMMVLGIVVSSTNLVSCYTYQWIPEWGIDDVENSYKAELYYDMLCRQEADSYTDFVLTEEDMPAIDEFAKEEFLEGKGLFRVYLHDYFEEMNGYVKKIIMNHDELSYLLPDSNDGGILWSEKMIAEGIYSGNTLTIRYFRDTMEEPLAFLENIENRYWDYYSTLDLSYCTSLDEYLEAWENLTDRPTINDADLHLHDLYCMEVYGDVISQTADCKSSGEVKYCCTLCGTAYTFEVEKGEHVKVVEEVEPDCTNDGYRKETCSVCGEELLNDVIPATGHNAQAKVTTVTATCTEDGYERTECPDCGEVFDEKTIPATGHDNGFFTCSACGQVNFTHLIPVAGGVAVIMIVLIVILLRKKK